MTRIDAARRPSVLLRADVAARGTRKPASAPAPAGARPSASTEAARLAAPRIHAIAPDDPQRRQKAVRIFLETVLARELGAGLLQDASFPPMLDAVQAQMQDDRDLARLMDAAGEALLAAAAAK